MIEKPGNIVIIGPPGSGKSTLGHELACCLGYRVIDLDEFQFLSGWQVRPDDEFFSLVEEAIAEDGWILCGNYSRTRPMVWPRASLIVWLDFPFLPCLYRVLKRSVRRIWTGERCCNGNRETLGRFFGRRSILYWLVRHYLVKKRRGYTQNFDANPYNSCSTVVRLCHRRDVQEFFLRFPKERSRETAIECSPTL